LHCLVVSAVGNVAADSEAFGGTRLSGVLAWSPRGKIVAIDGVGVEIVGIVGSIFASS
jgi:hypothetical protein